MDAMGDADELSDDEDPQPDRPPVFTPEAQVFTAAGLVLFAFFAGGLFQYLSFFAFNGPQDPALQYAVYAGPSGVLAATGAVVGWRARMLDLGSHLRGVAVASAVVGALFAVVVVIGIAVAYTTGPDTTF